MNKPPHLNAPRIAVLGAGQMGSGIAHVCAVAGLHTALFDNQPTQLPKALDAIKKNLAAKPKNKSSVKRPPDWRRRISAPNKRWAIG